VRFGDAPTVAALLRPRIRIGSGRYQDAAKMAVPLALECRPARRMARFRCDPGRTPIRGRDGAGTLVESPDSNLGRGFQMLAAASHRATPAHIIRRRVLRTPIALALTAAALSVVVPDAAVATAPVPCSNAGGGHFNCGFYPRAGAPVQAADGRTVGTLHRGTNWVICQRVGGRVTSGPYYNNNWAWTLADNNRWGWVNAVWGQGGANNGPFGGVPVCGGAQGNPPGAAGPTPPPPAVPPPSTIPAAWSNGPVNAPAWRPSKRNHSSISCGARSIPADLRPESVSRGWTARTQAIVTVIRGPQFGWTNVGGAANGTQTGHISGSYHYCGRGIDAFAPGVRAGTRATGAGLRASWRLANWAAHNAPALRVSQVIFYDLIWTADGGGWRRYTNDGGSGNTRQHRDHVHLSVY